MYETEEYPYLGPATTDWRDSDDPEAAIVNPIDPALSPDAKVDELRRLSNENIPVIEAIIADLQENDGLKGKYSRKNADRIQAKASRPSIRAKNPWHDVEHIRDGLRFKVVLDHFDKIEAITETLHKHGVKVIKFDHKKMFAPKPWGWRFVAWDIQMPNGQLVEFYAPLPALSRKEVKHTNHLLFEKWRNLSDEQISSNPEMLAAYRADIKESKDRYDAAFAEELARMGYEDETAALASWNSFVERAESLISEKSSMNSTAVGTPTLQTPSTDRRKLSSGEPPQTDNSPLSDSNASIGSSFSTPENTTGQQEKQGRRLDSLEVLFPSTTISHEVLPTRRGGLGSQSTAGGLRSGDDNAPSGQPGKAQEGTGSTGAEGAGTGSVQPGQPASAGGGDSVGGRGSGARQGTGAVRPGRVEETAGGTESDLAGLRGLPPVIPTPEKPEDRNNRISSTEKVAPRSEKAKIEANFAAIELLRTLENEERNPNAEERAVLEQYTGWGFLKEAFNTVRRARYERLKNELERYYGDKWEEHAYDEEDKAVVAWYNRYAAIQDRLKKAFGEKEFLAAEKSVRNAHFTTPEVLGGMWDAVRRLGFRGGKAVEPSGGAGHAIGTIPGRWPPDNGEDET